MKQLLQDLFDEFGAPRTTSARTGQILAILEGLLAEICVQEDEVSVERRRNFIALQDTFECNIPSRLLTWMAGVSFDLEAMTNKPAAEREKETETSTLSSQLIQALSIIQGVVLMHEPSKCYFGRRFPLQTLLDLLLTSRHVDPMPLNTPTNIASPPSSPESRAPRTQKPTPSADSLASVLLDTLLCIMVDSPPALRVFEQQNGVQVVVKILKRSGTPREVRMKCLEFFYFYLLDETAEAGKSPQDPAELQSLSASSTLVSRSPPLKKPSHRSVASVAGSIDFSLPPSKSSPSSSFNSSASMSFSSLQASLESRRSTSDTPTSAPPPQNSTAASSVPALLPSPRIITPPSSRALLMLRKDIDYTPQSPKKAHISRLGVGTPRQASSLRSQTRSRGASDHQPDSEPDAPQRSRGLSASSSSQDEMPVSSDSSSPGAARAQSKTPVGVSRHRRAQSCMDASAATPVAPAWKLPIDTRVGSGPVPRKPGLRTMEEKKEILGSMLGNVDALVESVRKAGIWGLG